MEDRSVKDEWSNTEKMGKNILGRADKTGSLLSQRCFSPAQVQSCLHFIRNLLASVGYSPFIILS